MIIRMILTLVTIFHASALYSMHSLAFHPLDIKVDKKPSFLWALCAQQLKVVQKPNKECLEFPHCNNDALKIPIVYRYSLDKATQIYQENKKTYDKEPEIRYDRNHYPTIQFHNESRSYHCRDIYFFTFHTFLRDQRDDREVPHALKNIQIKIEHPEYDSDNDSLDSKVIKEFTEKMKNYELTYNKKLLEYCTQQAEKINNNENCFLARSDSRWQPLYLLIRYIKIL